MKRLLGIPRRDAGGCELSLLSSLQTLEALYPECAPACRALLWQLMQAKEKEDTFEAICPQLPLLEVP